MLHGGLNGGFWATAATLGGVASEPDQDGVLLSFAVLNRASNLLAARERFSLILRSVSPSSGPDFDHPFFLKLPHGGAVLVSFLDRTCSASSSAAWPSGLPFESCHVSLLWLSLPCCCSGLIIRCACLLHARRSPRAMSNARDRRSNIMRWGRRCSVRIVVQHSDNERSHWNQIEQPVGTSCARPIL